MLEATTMMATLTTATTSAHDYNADNDVRSVTSDDNTGYCDNLSTVTTMQTILMTSLATTSADNDVRSANNGDNAGYCDNHSTLTAMQRTMLEAPTTMWLLRHPQHTDSNGENDVRSNTNLGTLTTMQTTMLEAPSR